VRDVTTPLSGPVCCP